MNYDGVYTMGDVPAHGGGDGGGGGAAAIIAAILLIGIMVVVAECAGADDGLDRESYFDDDPNAVARSAPACHAEWKCWPMEETRVREFEPDIARNRLPTWECRSIYGEHLAVKCGDRWFHYAHRIEEGKMRPATEGGYGAWAYVCGLRDELRSMGRSDLLDAPVRVGSDGIGSRRCMGDVVVYPAGP